MAGLNTLDFHVENGGGSANPAGFRTELTGEAAPLPVSGSICVPALSSWNLVLMVLMTVVPSAVWIRHQRLNRTA